MSRVLIVCDYFPPSERAGGPSRSIWGIVRSEMHRHRIDVLTRDHDIGGTPVYSPEQTALVDSQLPATQVTRVSKRHQYFTIVRELKKACPAYDVVYLNSIWSTAYTILPLILRKLGIVRGSQVMLAPRGELSEGALSVKSVKKAVAAPILRWLTSGTGLYWHASSPREAADIRRFTRDRRQRIHVQANPAPSPALRATYPANSTTTVAFIARMAPIKNFLQLARAAQLVDFRLNIIVAGSLEDRGYWQKCLEILGACRDTVSIDIKGHLNDDQVVQLLQSVDAMVTPTLGENFGRSIAESLAQGCPVMVPDTTLWTQLIEKGAGWLIDTVEPDRLVAVLYELNSLSERQRRSRRDETLKLYTAWYCAEQAAMTSHFG